MVSYFSTHKQVVDSYTPIVNMLQFTCAKPPESDLSQDNMYSGKVTCKIYNLCTWIYRIYHQ